MLRPLPYIDMIVEFAEAVVAGSCLRCSLPKRCCMEELAAQGQVVEYDEGNQKPGR
jgi:hypothetical protein